MIQKEPSPQVGGVRVIFEIPASLWADQIYLVGDFNKWNSRASPLRRMPNGIWSIILDLPKWRRYEFRYLVDDHWLTDFHADGCITRTDHTINSYVVTILPVENLASHMAHGI